MKKALLWLPLFLLVTGCNNHASENKPTQDGKDTLKTEEEQKAPEKEVETAKKEDVKRPTKGNPISYSYEEAEKYAKASGLKYTRLNGMMEVLGQAGYGNRVLVEFRQLVRDSEDESNAEYTKPFRYEIDLDKTRFFNYDEKCEISLGCMEVVMEEAHIGSVMIYVTDDVVEEFPLVLAVQEDVAG